jgi:hypothetical protein
LITQFNNDKVTLHGIMIKHLILSKKHVLERVANVLRHKHSCKGIKTETLTEESCKCVKTKT